MRAGLFHRHGGLKELKLEEVPTPAPGPGEIQVKVAACALNHLDLWVRRLTGKRGVDFVFEHTGAATWPHSIQCAARGGRIATCGATSGYDARTDLRYVFSKQLTIIGSTMGAKGRLFDLVALLRAGKIRPVVDRTLPLAEVATGQRLLEERQVFGKIVLQP